MTRSTPYTHPQSPSLTVDDTDITAAKLHKSSALEETPSDFMLCCYQNQKSSIQVIRSMSETVPQWHLERVIFPAQRLIFYAPPESKIQVYNGNFAENLRCDTIPCDRLQAHPV